MPAAEPLSRISSLELTRRFEESYRQLDSRTRWLCRRSLRLLLEEPGHPRLGGRPILPDSTCWEGRVGPDHRLLFRPAGDSVLILDVVEAEDAEE